MSDTLPHLRIRTSYGPTWACAHCSRDRNRYVEWPCEAMIQHEMANLPIKPNCTCGLSDPKCATLRSLYGVPCCDECDHAPTGGSEAEGA